jgi:3-isopropylmalate/(R)-2-methylmalate dehydratase large subunit
MTIAEKILSKHSGKTCYSGETVIAELDAIMFHDGTFNLVTKAWEKIGVKKVHDPSKVVLIIDHSAPSPNERASNLHKRMRIFAEDNGIKLYDVGAGICHQIVPEGGHAVPGDLIVGADSHTVTYGAINAFSTGVGATDLAAALTSGKLWFRVPNTIRVNMKGKLSQGVYSKDIILWLAREIGADGATYKALEFGGSGLGYLSIDSRLTISNMAIELGGKAGLMESDTKTLEWVKIHSDRSPNPVQPDNNANYEQVLDVDLSKLAPMVAKPHQVDNVSSIEEVEGTPINQGVIGTCTNGRLEDLEIAAKIAAGEKIHPQVRLIVAPASRDIYSKALKQGVISILVDAGASIITPGCGPCLGTHNGIPADGENVISTANRNFKGRMGNDNAFIYLGSPATVIASSIKGKITDPRGFI